MGRGKRYRKFFAEAVEALVGYAEWRFRLERKREDGASEGDHLAAAESIIKNLPGWKSKRELIPDAPPFPEIIAHVWDWFGEIAYGLKSNGMGPSTIGWDDLTNWQREMDIECDRWEKLALVRLGNSRAVIEGEKMAAEQKKPREPK